MTRPETRARLLDAAFSLILDEGYAQLSIARMADRLGMTAANIYTHVSSRAELADAVNEMQFERLQRRLLAVATSRLPAPERLLRLVLENLAYHQEIGRQSPFLAELIGHAAGEGWTSHRSIILALRRFFDRIVLRGVRDGSFASAPEPRLLKAGFLALRPVMDPLMIREAKPEELQLDAQAAVELVITGLGGRFRQDVDGVRPVVES